MPDSSTPSTSQFMTAEHVQVMQEVFCSAEEQGFLHTIPSKDMPDNMNCARIHVSPDAGATTYMYEFQYHPSFLSKPNMVMGDHGDELYSVFGAPILRGNGASLPVCWWLRDLGSSFASVTLSTFLLS